MRFLLAFLLLAHGVAHLVGFAVPWRFIQDPDITFGSTLFGGRLDVGDAGMRALGVGWLLLAVGFALAAVSVAFGAAWAPAFTLAAVALSSLFCLVFLPDARWGLLVNVGVVVMLAFWSVGVATERWEGATAGLRDELAAAAPDAAGVEQTVAASTSDAGDLPAPVARYLAYAVPPARSPIRSVQLAQSGEFFMAAGDGGAWQPFTATQTFATRPAGFVWDARIRMMPLVDAFVRDAYVSGEASMVASAAGLVTLVDQHHSPELAAGALMRFLAEAVWFPSALAPQGQVRWEPIDDARARATLTDGPTVVSLEFRFNERNEVAEVFSPDRFREVDGRFEPTPWRVTCLDYAEFDGVRIPTRCEVAWELPEGRQVYWKGTVREVTYGY